MTYTETQPVTINPQRYRKLEQLHDIIATEMPTLIDYVGKLFPAFKVAEPTSFKVAQQKMKKARKIMSLFCDIHKVLKDIESCNSETT
jgi:hypothetical protein